jgi:nicotinamide-nucleotide amidase
MNAEIITVGSELLLGQIVNSNAKFLSSQLAELGINVYYHTAVGDNSERLKSVIQIAQKRSDLIIITGGLGPTKDDLTKETIADLLGKKLVIDQYALDQISRYFQLTNRNMTENNKKQALVIEGSTVLKNDFGMAPGMAFSVNGITYMLLPGPPKEMEPMFINYGRKYLMDSFLLEDRIVSRVLRFFGIGESQLETDIQDLIDSQSNPTIAPLASDQEVTLRLTAKHSSIDVAERMLDEIEAKIQQRVGQFFYGYDSTSLAEELLKQLMHHNLTIASAESLTGGMFSESLTAIPGSSSVLKGGIVCYSNDIKEHMLKVKRSTLTTEGAVSEACAKEMAENVRRIMHADIGISFTGVAGPTELEGKPVGTVYIGIAKSNEPTKIYSLQLAGNRQSIRKRTIKYGCYYLLQDLKSR